MSKHELELRRRPRLDEDIVAVHARWVNVAAGLPHPWRIDPTAIDMQPAARRAHSLALVRLNKGLGKGLRGYVQYALRKAAYLEDAAQFDDFIVVVFNARGRDYEQLAREVFPPLIQAFGAYRANVYNVAKRSDDWSNVVDQCRATGRDIDGRDGVYAISALNYFDRLLCKRAFETTPEHLVEKLQRRALSASLFNDGAIVDWAGRFLNADELTEADAQFRTALAA